ncbi:AI-2E family transporter [Fulvivirga sp. RKSG066]|uniref:AI-2E family transporter n=1 Tax=Fulvivirga aurantia TaxID=2529383 RepID=UPI0012BCC461|nr:AI-2E family transporter [Fulvivirga aurantia]MTI20326.1 AI-2E family transporter [Fulvivirga aurantia]
MTISFKNTFYTLATVFAVIFLLYLGRTVLVPLAFGLLIAFILYPVCRWLEKKGVGRAWAIIWTMLSVTLVLLGITVLFSTQIIDILQELDDFSQRLNEVLVAVTEFLNKNVSIIPNVDKDSIVSMGLQWFSNKSGGMLSNTLNRTALFVTGLTLSIIYTFLILLYRKQFRNAFISFAEEQNQSAFSEMISNIQRIGQKYLTGMFVLILILGTLNSLGLFIIGIDYALFFGFLAGFLAIIPYVGTTIGGAIPAIYAFMNYDSYWYPLGVIGVFWFVQLLEGNILSPKIVGGNLNVNALASILALIIGGAVWGIAGMVLFLPYAAILKVACEYYDNLKPLGLLMRDDVSRKKGKSFEEKMKQIFKK